MIVDLLLAERLMDLQLEGNQGCSAPSCQLRLEEVHLRNLFEEFRSRNKLRPFAPIPEQGRICPICNRNDEATEFILAIMLATVDTFLNESEEFRRLLIDKGYARDRDKID